MLDRITDRILNSGSSVWQGRGIIFSVDDIEGVIQENQECKEKTLPLKDILMSVSGHRSYINGAEREFIDRQADRAAEAIISGSCIENYGYVKAYSEKGWHRDYLLGKIALVMKQTEKAFSLNGGGIDAVSAYSEERMENVDISLFPYDLNQMGVDGAAELNSERGFSFLWLDRDSGLHRYIDLPMLFRESFPREDMICPYAQGLCAHEIESINSACYTGGFRECEIHHNSFGDGK